MNFLPEYNEIQFKNISLWFQFKTVLRAVTDKLAKLSISMSNHLFSFKDVNCEEDGAVARAKFPGCHNLRCEIYFSQKLFPEWQAALVSYRLAA